MTAVIMLAAGLLAGALQVGLLARDARHPGVSFFPVRLALVAGVLLLAASTGHLLAGAAGWAIGFASTMPIAYRRLS